MERRQFLEVTGLAAVAAALGIAPGAAKPALITDAITPARVIAFDKGLVNFGLDSAIEGESFDSFGGLVRSTLTIDLSDLDKHDELEAAFFSNEPTIFKIQFDGGSWEIPGFIRNYDFAGWGGGRTPLHVEVAVSGEPHAPNR